MRTLLIVTAAAAFVGCTGGEDPLRVAGSADPIEAVVGEPFVLSVGGEARLEDGRLTLELLRVPEDSRCPVDVTCVWEGNAALELRATLDDVTEQIRLDTHELREVAVDGFVVVLDSIAPEMREGRRIEQEDYRATLRVERAEP